MAKNVKKGSGNDAQEIPVGTTLYTHTAKAMSIMLASTHIGSMAPLKYFTGEQINALSTATNKMNPKVDDDDDTLHAKGYAIEALASDLITNAKADQEALAAISHLVFDNMTKRKFRKK